MILTPEEVLELIPHRAPFRFIDTIYNIEDKSIDCSYTFKHDEDFYKGHFPGNPVTPGVILVEAATQMSNVAHAMWLIGNISENKEQILKYATYITSVDSADFIKKVLPGEKVTVSARLISWRKMSIKHDVIMKNSNDEVVMTCICGGVGVKK